MKNTKKHIYSIFERLYNECTKDGVYSVIETAGKMGIDYKQIEAWAAADEDWFEMLELCRGSCHVNSRKDTLLKKISFLQYLKYQVENDEDYRDERTYEQIKELEQEQNNANIINRVTTPKKLLDNNEHQK